VRHGRLLAWLLTRLLPFRLLIRWWRRASLCSIQVDVGKGSWRTTCQLRPDSRCTWSRRRETMVTIGSLARRSLFVIFWLTERRLLSDTPQLLKRLRNWIKLLLRICFLLLLLLLVWRGYIEDVITDVELEVGSRISWLWAGRGGATLYSLARSCPSSKALGWAGILFRVSARRRCPCIAVAIGRRESCWSLHLVLALSPCKRAVEEASLLLHRAFFDWAGLGQR
jgi:hypothetical protein